MIPLSKQILDTYPKTEDPNHKGVYYPTPPIAVKFPVVENFKFNQTGKVIGGMAATIEIVTGNQAKKETFTPQGFNVPMQITKKMLVIKVQQGVVGGTKGGGRYYGLMSLEPKLVQ